MDGQPVNRVFDTLPTKTGDFAMTELREAIKSTTGNRATEFDGIPAEVGSLNVSMINYLKCVTEPITETYPICG